MTTRALALLATLCLGSLVLGACDRDDGEPDPAPQQLVPCDPRAAEGDPSACPPDAAPTDAPPLDAASGK